MGTSQACPGLPKGEHTAKLLLLACCTQEVSQVLRKPLIPDAPRTITVRYQAGPAPGLKFFPDQVYTSVTSDWMPCDDGPGERATLHLTITAPPDIKAAGSGQLIATRASEGRTVTELQLDSPTGPYWFGFALGGFAENPSDAEGVKLRVLGGGTQIFEPTAAAMRYVAERTGKHYPDRKSTRLNSSHLGISYAVFCLKKKKKYTQKITEHKQTHFHTAVIT